MPVKFDGATSGDKYDYLPDVSKPFDKQVPQNTAGGNAEDTIQWTQCSGNREGDVDPPVPKGGSPDDSAV